MNVSLNCYVYSPEIICDQQRQEFPEVDPLKFMESAEAFSHLMADGSLMLDQLSQSDELAFEVMEAAQVNDLERVQQLLQGTGVEHDLDVEFTPSGITIKMRTSANAGDCCVLTMLLRW
ncbi:hypothetical protein J2R98_000987 [Alkalibacillus filiformis]|uniref:Uncharacterized protein n=1 Tax=Alkalibacillus filiformis TaxID=200990 RepID=A0ABU0DRV8_9BACI|nr:hypothetical protein [Alkalibacillus filiformis]MDQ0351184.1 hypothetical protein [Alkalibacillus filiformis]